MSETYIDLKKESQYVAFDGTRRWYQLQTHELRKVLGVNSKRLGKAIKGWTHVGDTRVMVLSAEEAKLRYPNANRPYRIIAECKYCKHLVPAGKLQQHIKVHPQREIFAAVRLER